MRGIKVGMWGIGVGMQGIRVGMQGIGVGMMGIRLGMRETGGRNERNNGDILCIGVELMNYN